jgi:hypothetical protein
VFLACFLVSQFSIAAAFFCAERRFPGGRLAGKAPALALCGKE